jgi:hypothetical protein
MLRELELPEEYKKKTRIFLTCAQNLAETGLYEIWVCHIQVSNTCCTLVFIRDPVKIDARIFVRINLRTC